MEYGKLRLATAAAALSLLALALPLLQAPPASGSTPAPSITATWDGFHDWIVVQWFFGPYPDALITTNGGAGIPGSSTTTSGQQGLETNPDTHVAIPITASTLGTYTYEMQPGTYSNGTFTQTGTTVTTQASVYIIATPSGSNVTISWNFGSYNGAFILDTSSSPYKPLPGGGALGQETGPTGSAEETGLSPGLDTYQIQLGNWGPGYSWTSGPTQLAQALVQPAPGPSATCSSSGCFEPYNSQFTGFNEPYPFGTGQGFVGGRQNGPNDVTVDSNGDAWVSSEFSDGISCTPCPTSISTTNSPTKMNVPNVNISGDSIDANPFFYSNGFVGQTTNSTYAEQIINGPHNTIWFSQGGVDLPTQVPSANWNQARIIGFDPSTKNFCIYDTPNTTDVVDGIAYDSLNNRIWFTDASNGSVNWFTAPTSSCGRVSGQSGLTITSTSQLTQLALCSGSPPPAGCVTTIPSAVASGGYPLGGMTFDPATSTQYPDGSVWYVDAFADTVERVNVSTGTVSAYALSANRDGYVWWLDDPYYLTTNSGNYIYGTEYLNSSVFRINKTTGEVDEVEVPFNADSTCSGVSQPHSIALSSAGVLYFTTLYCDQTHPAGSGTVGYINVGTDGSGWSTNPFTILTSISAGGGGLAVDPTNGGVDVLDGGSAVGGGVIRLVPNANVVSPSSNTSVLVPSNNANVSDSAVTVDASAPTTNPPTTRSVQFEISGNYTTSGGNQSNGTLSDYVVASGSVTADGWIGSWNTTAVPNGTYTLQSVITDTNGNTEVSAGITVTVNNSAPATSVLVPSPGATESGTATLDASASTNTALVQFEVTGGTYSDYVVGSAAPTQDGWILRWPTNVPLFGGVPNGTYNLQSFACYGGGVCATSALIQITVSNN